VTVVACARCGREGPAACPGPELIEGQDEDVVVVAVPPGFRPSYGTLVCTACLLDADELDAA